MHQWTQDGIWLANSKNNTDPRQSEIPVETEIPEESETPTPVETEVPVESVEPTNPAETMVPIEDGMTLVADKILGAEALFNDVPFEGDGTESNPYIIDSFEDMNALHTYGTADSVVYYSLGADIVMPENTNWVPIGTEDAPFIGSFEGDGCFIENLNVDTEDNYEISINGQTGKFYDIWNNNKNQQDVNIQITEDEAKERHVMTMQDWIDATDDLLKFRRKDVLKNSGK